MGELTPNAPCSRRGVLLFRAGELMATASEITELSRAVARADEQINAALDLADEHAFHQWCDRRTSLITRIERALLALANARVAA